MLKNLLELMVCVIEDVVNVFVESVFEVMNKSDGCNVIIFLNVLKFTLDRIRGAASSKVGSVWDDKVMCCKDVV